MKNNQDTVTVDRHKYVGGSDLPNILGLNEIKYPQGGSIFEFAKVKVGLAVGTFVGNPYTKYGQLMEPIIRDYINATNGTNYREESIIDQETMQRGNTDGIDRDATDLPPMIEIKTFGEAKGLDVEYYTPQGRFYMERFDQDAIAYVGYPRPDGFYTGVDYDLENGDEFFDLSFDPERLVIEVVERDSVEWNRIQERITAFQNACVELKKKPDMTLDEWNTLFYGADLVKTQNQLIKLEDKLVAFNAIKEQHDEIKTKLIEQFEKYNVKTLDTGSVRITRVLTAGSTKEVFDEAKFKKKHPELHTEFNTKKKVTKGKDYLLINVKELGGNLQK